MCKGYTNLLLCSCNCPLTACAGDELMHDGTFTPLCLLRCGQVAAALGCRCFIAMPDDAAIEKVYMLQALGGL